MRLGYGHVGNVPHARLKISSARRPDMEESKRPRERPRTPPRFYTLGATQRSAARALLDAVTSRAGPVFATDEGYYPLQIPSAHLRAGLSAPALGFHGICARISREVRHGHRPPARTVGRGENGLSGRGHSCTPEYKSTCAFRPSQENPSNKWRRRNSLPGSDLGRVIGGLVGQLEGRFCVGSGVRFST